MVPGTQEKPITLRLYRLREHTERSNDTDNMTYTMQIFPWMCLSMIKHGLAAHLKSCCKYEMPDPEALRVIYKGVELKGRGMAFAQVFGLGTDVVVADYLLPEDAQPTAVPDFLKEKEAEAARDKDEQLQHHDMIDVEEEQDHHVEQQDDTGSPFSSGYRDNGDAPFMPLKHEQRDGKKATEIAVNGGNNESGQGSNTRFKKSNIAVKTSHSDLGCTRKNRETSHRARALRHKEMRQGRASRSGHEDYHADEDESDSASTSEASDTADEDENDGLTSCQREATSLSLSTSQIKSHKASSTPAGTQTHGETASSITEKANSMSSFPYTNMGVANRHHFAGSTSSSTRGNQTSSRIARRLQLDPDIEFHLHPSTSSSASPTAARSLFSGKNICSSNSVSGWCSPSAGGRKTIKSATSSSFGARMNSPSRKTKKAPPLSRRSVCPGAIAATTARRPSGRAAATSRAASSRVCFKADPQAHQDDPDVKSLIERAAAAFSHGAVPKITAEGTGGTYMIFDPEENGGPTKSSRGRMLLPPTEAKPLGFFKPKDEEVHAAFNPRGAACASGDACASTFSAPQATPQGADSAGRSGAPGTGAAAGTFATAATGTSGTQQSQQGHLGGGNKDEVDAESSRPGVYATQQACREVAAYVLDRGWAGVPPTIMCQARHPAFCNPHEGVIWKHGSLQKRVDASDCLGDFGRGLFSVEQVHNIGILDIRILNMDRNEGNCLVKESFIEEDVEVPEDEEFSSQPAGEPRTRIEKRKRRHLQLIPIDHGLSLPDRLDIAASDLTWMSFPQAKEPFSEETRQKIKDLNPELDRENLSKYCGIKNEALRWMQVATVLLKVGAEMGLTLYEIGTILYRDVEDEPGPGPSRSLGHLPAETASRVAPEATSTSASSPSTGPASDPCVLEHLSLHALESAVRWWGKQRRLPEHLGGIPAARLSFASKNPLASTSGRRPSERGAGASEKMAGRAVGRPSTRQALARCDSRDDQGLASVSEHEDEDDAAEEGPAASSSRRASTQGGMRRYPRRGSSKKRNSQTWATRHSRRSPRRSVLVGDFINKSTAKVRGSVHGQAVKLNTPYDDHDISCSTQEATTHEPTTYQKSTTPPSPMTFENANAVTTVPPVSPTGSAAKVSTPLEATSSRLGATKSLQQCVNSAKTLSSESTTIPPMLETDETSRETRGTTSACGRKLYRPPAVRRREMQAAFAASNGNADGEELKNAASGATAGAGALGHKEKGNIQGRLLGSGTEKMMALRRGGVGAFNKKNTGGPLFPTKMPENLTELQSQMVTVRKSRHRLHSYWDEEFAAAKSPRYTPLPAPACRLNTIENLDLEPVPAAVEASCMSILNDSPQPQSPASSGGGASPTGSNLTLTGPLEFALTGLDDETELELTLGSAPSRSISDIKTEEKNTPKDIEAATGVAASAADVTTKVETTSSSTIATAIGPCLLKTALVADGDAFDMNFLISPTSSPHNYSLFDNQCDRTCVNPFDLFLDKPSSGENKDAPSASVRPRSNSASQSPVGMRGRASLLRCRFDSVSLDQPGERRKSRRLEPTEDDPSRQQRMVDLSGAFDQVHAEENTVFLPCVPHTSPTLVALTSSSAADVCESSGAGLLRQGGAIHMMLEKNNCRHDSLVEAGSFDEESRSASTENPNVSSCHSEHGEPLCAGRQVEERARVTNIEELARASVTMMSMCNFSGYSSCSSGEVDESTASQTQKSVDEKSTKAVPRSLRRKSSSRRMSCRRTTVSSPKSGAAQNSQTTTPSSVGTLPWSTVFSSRGASSLVSASSSCNGSHADAHVRGAGSAMSTSPKMNAARPLLRTLTQDSTKDTEAAALHDPLNRGELDNRPGAAAGPALNVQKQSMTVLPSSSPPKRKSRSDAGEHAGALCKRFSICETPPPGPVTPTVGNVSSEQQSYQGLAAVSPDAASSFQRSLSFVPKAPSCPQLFSARKENSTLDVELKTTDGTSLNDKLEQQGLDFPGGDAVATARASFVPIVGAEAEEKRLAPTSSLCVNMERFPSDMERFPSISDSGDCDFGSRNIDGSLVLRAADSSTVDMTKMELVLEECADMARNVGGNGRICSVETGLLFGAGAKPSTSFVQAGTATGLFTPRGVTPNEPVAPNGPSLLPLRQETAPRKSSRNSSSKTSGSSAMIGRPPSSKRGSARQRVQRKSSFLGASISEDEMICLPSPNKQVINRRKLSINHDVAHGCIKISSTQKGSRDDIIEWDSGLEVAFLHYVGEAVRTHILLCRARAKRRGLPVRYSREPHLGSAHQDPPSIALTSPVGAMGSLPLASAGTSDGATTTQVLLPTESCEKKSQEKVPVQKYNDQSGNSAGGEAGPGNTDPKLSEKADLSTISKGNTTTDEQDNQMIKDLKLKVESSHKSNGNAIYTVCVFDTDAPAIDGPHEKTEFRIDHQTLKGRESDCMSNAQDQEEHKSAMQYRKRSPLKRRSAVLDGTEDASLEMCPPRPRQVLKLNFLHGEESRPQQVSDDQQKIQQQVQGLDGEATKGSVEGPLSVKTNAAARNLSYRPANVGEGIHRLKRDVLREMTEHFDDEDQEDDGSSPTKCAKRRQRSPVPFLFSSPAVLSAGLLVQQHHSRLDVDSGPKNDYTCSWTSTSNQFCATDFNTSSAMLQHLHKPMLCAPSAASKSTASTASVISTNGTATTNSTGSSLSLSWPTSPMLGGSGTTTLNTSDSEPREVKDDQEVENTINHTKASASAMIPQETTIRNREEHIFGGRVQLVHHNDQQEHQGTHLLKTLLPNFNYSFDVAGASTEGETHDQSTLTSSTHIAGAEHEGAVSTFTTIAAAGEPASPGLITLPKRANSMQPRLGVTTWNWSPMQPDSPSMSSEGEQLHGEDEEEEQDEENIVLHQEEDQREDELEHYSHKCTSQQRGLFSDVQRPAGHVVNHVSWKDDSKTAYGGGSARRMERDLEISTSSVNSTPGTRTTARTTPLSGGFLGGDVFIPPIRCEQNDNSSSPLVLGSGKDEDVVVAHARKEGESLGSGRVGDAAEEDTTRPEPYDHERAPPDLSFYNEFDPIYQLHTIPSHDDI
ncbi:unnamed protein product [Amoebophrya sp. A25]|nr:unnamed protein product [Amoebophrya sp. A25]|eukprot:GSA25T00006011001.1